MEQKHVLLLGNGLNNAYGGTSWNTLIKDIAVRTDFDVEKLTLPMPMQAILMTNNNIKDAMLGKSKKLLGSVNSEQSNVLRQLFDLNFDDILTTNYSYEIEASALGKDEVSENMLKKYVKATKGHAETRYLLHTYNNIPYNGKEMRVWHIHGESRKPDSMILGHYWYGNMLAKMKAETDSSGSQYKRLQDRGLPISYDSWVDSFILGNVYVLGLSYDTSEIDLWWLLNRKKREKAETGKFYFYEMHSEKKREKTELLKLLGAEVINFEMESPARDDPDRDARYKTFYEKAIADISEKVRNGK